MTISKPPGVPGPQKPPPASPSGPGGKLTQVQQIQAKLMAVVQGIPGATNPEGGIDETNRKVFVDFYHPDLPQATHSATGGHLLAFNHSSDMGPTHPRRPFEANSTGILRGLGGVEAARTPVNEPLLEASRAPLENHFDEI